MSENKKIINEFFFKKETYSDKLKRKLPQYKPQDVRDEGREGFGSIVAPTADGLAVTDPQEAGKRVVSALGASLGMNSIRNIASRSIKSFPIVISENVDPETSVMLKRVLEEQYAEYMSLLISNQIVDITAFQTGEKEGNIAIQALSSVSSEDESKMLARKVAKGEVEPEDFLKGLTAYNLIRNEGTELRTGNKIMDALLENAVVVPESESKKLVEFMVANSGDIVSLLEMSDAEKKKKIEENIREIKSLREKKNLAKLGGAVKPDLDFYDEKIKELEDEVSELRGEKKEKGEKDEGDRKDRKDKEEINVTLTKAIESNIEMSKKAVEKAEELLKSVNDDSAQKGPFKMKDPEIVVNSKLFKENVSRSLGRILLDEKNEPIRDKFEKATFLMQSNRISGIEWIQYLQLRLGIPVSKQTRQYVVAEFPERDVIDFKSRSLGKISRGDINRINRNMRVVERTLLQVLSFTGGEIIKFGLTAGVVGGIAGGATALASVAGGATAASLMAPVLLGLPLFLIVGAAVGVPIAAIHSIRSNIRRSRKTESIVGWERVEALIEMMEEQQRSVRKIKVVDPTEDFTKAEKQIENTDDMITATEAELKAALSSYHDHLSGMMSKARPNQSLVTEDVEPIAMDGEAHKLALSESRPLIEAALNSKEARAHILAEAIVSTKIPTELVATQTYEYDTDKGPEVLAVPKFATRDQFAYGSVEYEKRDLKDRKYNAPLLMTVKFKQRFDDGTFSDNELVAVIGILGVITRVPAEEMEYILASNADGKTVKGILEPDGDPAQLISNIIGIERISKDVENLPISRDVWQNLEKVSRLAVTNKLAGRKNENIANAHIVFSQQEIDNVRADEGADYMKGIDLVRSLMKRYSAFTVMIANDVSERLYIFDDQESANWDVVPYSAYRNKDTGDQLNAMLNKMSSGRL
jgi:hypothetical protein